MKVNRSFNPILLLMSSDFVRVQSKSVAGILTHIPERLTQNWPTLAISTCKYSQRKDQKNLIVN